MHESWKIEAFEAMGEKLSVAKSAIGRVESTAREEGSELNRTYLKTSDRQSEIANRMLETHKQLEKARQTKDVAKIRELTIQLRAETDLTERLGQELKVCSEKQKNADGRAEKLRKDLSELESLGYQIEDWERKIAQKRDDMQGKDTNTKELLAEQIKSDQESLARVKANQEKLEQSVDNCLKATDAKLAVNREKKADEEARATWPKGEQEKYAKLGTDIDRKKTEALYQDANSKALDESFKLYERIDNATAAKEKATIEVNRLTRAFEAAQADVKKIGILTNKEWDKEVTKAKEEAEKQLAEAKERLNTATQELYFANQKVGEGTPVLPRDELRKRKENFDVAKATLDKEAAQMSLEKGEIAATQTREQREAAQKNFDDKLGGDLVKRVAETGEKRDKAFEKMRQAQGVIDLVKSSALGPDDPEESLKLAEKSRDHAENEARSVRAELERAKEEQKKLANASDNEKAAMAHYIEALEEDLAARVEAHDIAATAAAQRKTACDKLRETGALEAKKQKIETEKALAQAKEQLDQLRKATGLLDKEKDQSKIAENERAIEVLEGNIKGFVLVIGTKQKAIEERMNTAVEAERKELNKAIGEAKKANTDAEKAEEEKENKIKGDPELKKAKDDLEKKIADEVRAMSEKIMAETFMDAAAKDLAIAQFQQKIGQSKEKHQAAFEKFGGLTDKSFDEIYDKHDNDFENAIQKLATIPDPKDSKKRIPNPEYEKEYNTAKEAFVELIEQDQILEDLGASFEDRLRAFQGVPKALWPPKFREEAKAFREVQLLIEKEKVEEEAIQKQKEEIKAGLLETLGEAYEAVGPVLDVVFASLDAVSSIQGIGKEETTPETVKEKLAMMKSIGAALVSFASSNYSAVKELAEGEGEEGKKGEKDKPGEKPKGGEGEDESVKKKGPNDQTLKVLEFIKSALVSQATLTGSVLTAVGKEVPGIDVALGAIETAEAVYAAGKSIKMAYDEHTIQGDVDSEDDEIMKKAMSNQTGRSKEISVKRSVNATAKGIQLAGSSVTASGVGAAVGVGLKVGGVGLEQGNKFAFQCIDWKAAAKAKATLDKAVAGSYAAMQQVFADHQMYATSYIVLRARDGDISATKMCVGRGVDQGKLLDEAVSIKLIRKLMLEVVDQQDHMETVGETAANTWDKICKVGKVIKSKFKDDAPETTSPSSTQTPPSTGPSGSIPSQTQIETYLKTAADISDRFKIDPTSYTVKDCTDRMEIVERQVPNIRKLLTQHENNAEGFRRLAGAAPDVVKGQADRLNMFLYALPKKPLSREMRPAKKEFSTAEERLRRTR